MSNKNYLVSEDQVKKALHINTFRNLSKDKVMEFVNLIPQMDKEVAMSIINQFPAYTKYATDIIGQLKDQCQTIASSSDSSRKDAVDAYTKILDTLSDMLKSGDLSENERGIITEQMIDVAGRIDKLDERNKKFLDKLSKRGTAVVMFALGLGAAILGVNIRGRNIPQIGDDDEDDDGVI